MIVDFRTQLREHLPIHIDGTAVEKVESFKFLGIHNTDNLKWSTYTDSVVKKAQQLQHLFNLRRLKKCGMSLKTLTNFHRCTIESILSGCITAWYGNCTPDNRRVLQRVVRSAQHWGQTTCPPGLLQNPMSQESQKDHQGQQPPEPLPVRPSTIQKTRSVSLGPRY